MAQPVAREGRVGVALVGEGSQAALAPVRLDGRAAGGQQGAQQPQFRLPGQRPGDGHAAQPAGASAAQQVQQDRLDLIVDVVAHGDGRRALGPRHAGQEVVAGGPAGLFQ